MTIRIRIVCKPRRTPSITNHIRIVCKRAAVRIVCQRAAVVPAKQAWALTLPIDGFIPATSTVNDDNRKIFKYN